MARALCFDCRSELIDSTDGGHRVCQTHGVQRTWAAVSDAGLYAYVGREGCGGGPHRGIHPHSRRAVDRAIRWQRADILRDTDAIVEGIIAGMSTVKLAQTHQIPGDVVERMREKVG